jgi:hypothetical protein
MSGVAASGRRGRPLKYGRAARLVTLTLPDDVIEWLGGIDDDLAWAVVKLHERSSRAVRRKTNSVADLVQLPGNRALILVQPEPFKRLKGVSIIPLADGRGFLALDVNRGVADLELAVLDRLEIPTISPVERDALTVMRTKLKQWRLDGIEFESRAIIVARRTSSRRGPRLAGLQSQKEHDAS